MTQEQITRAAKKAAAAYKKLFVRMVKGSMKTKKPFTIGNIRITVKTEDGLSNWQEIYFTNFRRDPNNCHFLLLVAESINWIRDILKVPKKIFSERKKNEREGEYGLSDSTFRWLGKYIMFTQAGKLRDVKDVNQILNKVQDLLLDHPG